MFGMRQYVFVSKKPRAAQAPPAVELFASNQLVVLLLLLHHLHHLRHLHLLHHQLQSRFCFLSSRAGGLVAWTKGCLSQECENRNLKILSVWAGNSAQCVHWTVFFPFDRARWDTLSNLETVILLNIYLSQRTRSKGTMRKLDFREPQTLNLWFSLKYSPVVTTKYAPLFPR